MAVTLSSCCCLWHEAQDEPSTLCDSAMWRCNLTVLNVILSCDVVEWTNSVECIDVTLQNVTVQCDSVNPAAHYTTPLQLFLFFLSEGFTPCRHLFLSEGFTPCRHLRTYTYNIHRVY